MHDDHLSEHLLEPQSWPAIVLASSHAPLLLELASFSLQLDEQTAGDGAADATLHRLLTGCARIAGWLPAPRRGRAPSYTRTAWDLRALSAIVPPGLDVELSGRVEDDGSGFKRWQANLHDHINGNLAVHPSDLEHNRALSYEGGEYGSAWTPNLALARILLAAYLLAALQAILGRVLPSAAAQTAPALADDRGKCVPASDPGSGGAAPG